MKTKTTKLRPWLISAYAKLVIANKYTLNEADVTEEIQLVPEAYQEAVSEFLIKYNKG
jgi:hypothetical protein